MVLWQWKIYRRLYAAKVVILIGHDEPELRKVCLGRRPFGFILKVDVSRNRFLACEIESAWLSRELGEEIDSVTTAGDFSLDSGSLTLMLAS
jgi:hypothetical protein